MLLACARVRRCRATDRHGCAYAHVYADGDGRPSGGYGGLVSVRTATMSLGWRNRVAEVNPIGLGGYSVATQKAQKVQNTADPESLYAGVVV